MQVVACLCAVVISLYSLVADGYVLKGNGPSLTANKPAKHASGKARKASRQPQMSLVAPYPLHPFPTVATEPKKQEVPTFAERLAAAAMLESSPDIQLPPEAIEDLSKSIRTGWDAVVMAFRRAGEGIQWFFDKYDERVAEVGPLLADIEDGTF